MKVFYEDHLPYDQQLVVSEHNELHDRITRLELFMATNEKFKHLHYREQELLRLQRSAMDLYRDVLRQRTELRRAK